MTITNVNAQMTATITNAFAKLNPNAWPLLVEEELPPLGPNVLYTFVSA